ALRKSQSVANDAKHEAKHTRRKLADVTNATKHRKGRKKQKKDHSCKATDTQMGEVRVLGRKFSVTRMLWLCDKKRAFTLKADNVYNPLERFKTDSTKMQGQLADLRNILPEALHDKMEDIEENGLADEFRAGMGEQRSQISTCIRHTSGPEIFDCTSQDLLSSNSRSMDQFREQIGWIRDDDAPGGGRYNPWVCALLHKDFRGTFDIDTAFLNPKLFLVHIQHFLLVIFASIVRRPSAVGLLKDHKNPVVQAETNDQIWGLQSEGTTAGDIAASVVVGRFSLSADDSLRENGKVTGINWAADYKLYLKYLTTGLEKRKTSVLKIFRVWDDIFFPGRSDASGRAENNGGSTVDAMDLLNANAEEEPEDGGCEASVLQSDAPHKTGRIGSSGEHLHDREPVRGLLADKQGESAR
ncbi:hypothetical protein B0H14DRAFT_2348812, partial [Mycena olivaceomarginata]